MDNTTQNTNEIPDYNTHFEILSAAAYMPNSCWGTYRRIGLLEVRNGKVATRIDDRLRCVVSMYTWERLNVGKTERCAYERAWAEAVDAKKRWELHRYENAMGAGI